MTAQPMAPAWGTPPAPEEGLRSYTVAGLVIGEEVPLDAEGNLDVGGFPRHVVLVNAASAREAEDSARAQVAEEGGRLMVASVLVAEDGIAKPVDDPYAVYEDPDRR